MECGRCVFPPPPLEGKFQAVEGEGKRKGEGMKEEKQGKRREGLIFSPLCRKWGTQSKGNK